LEYFENNFTIEELKASVRADPKMGDLVRRYLNVSDGQMDNVYNAPRPHDATELNNGDVIKLGDNHYQAGQYLSIFPKEI